MSDELPSGNAMQVLFETCQKLEAHLRWMNAVSNHQTNRLFPALAPFNKVHPFTCGNDSNHAPLFPLVTESGQRQLICRDCDYTQDVLTA